MSITPPKVILRIGSHAEKEYFEKLARNLDGLMFGANLLEITPAATCSLVFSLAAKRAGDGLEYYVDPMTYCFGPYIDPATGRRRNDLEVIKSERGETRGSKIKVKSVKDSYMTLAGQLGEIFNAAVNDGKSCKAIDPITMSNIDRDRLCKGVIKYQISRIAAILSEDELMKAEFTADCKPAAVFAPYFYVHESWARDGLEASIDLIGRTVALQPSVPVHAILCVCNSVLSNKEQVQYLVSELLKTNVKGVWLWFDGFDELSAPLEKLIAFREIVLGLRDKMEIYNLHGGYFSLLLVHDGLSGISHGVGYGEQKPVAQVIGAAAPTVRYYLPAIKKRVGVPDIQRSYSEAGITTAEDFYDKVCNCQICKGVIGGDINRFAAFGEMHRATLDSKKNTQTPVAAKMCRFHFLINRFRERGMVAGIERNQRASHVQENAAIWRKCIALQSHVGTCDTDGYLELWQKALAYVPKGIKGDVGLFGS